MDFSETVIQQMKSKYESTAPEMSWVVMDAMDMKEFADASFDIAIDKGECFLILKEIHYSVFWRNVATNTNSIVLAHVLF